MKKRVFTCSIVVAIIISLSLTSYAKEQVVTSLNGPKSMTICSCGDFEAEYSYDYVESTHDGDCYMSSHPSWCKYVRVIRITEETKKCANCGSVIYSGLKVNSVKVAELHAY